MRLSGWKALLLAFVLTLPLVTPKIRGADEIEYFSYLRSLAFDHDVEFGNEYRHFHSLNPQGLAGFKATFLDLRESQTGAHINFAPMGAGVLWSPFYLAAHLGVRLARAAGASVAADGFSLPYVAAACYASALYGFLGLLLVHDALIRFGRFSEATATFAVLAVWLGTPLLYYMTLAPAFSHACSVFAVALLVWLTLRLLDQGRSTPVAWATVGAALGLAGLVREQDALFVVVPAGVLLAEAVRTRDWPLALLKGLLFALCAALLFLPQLLAYRALNGTFSPSRMVARKLSYASPHFFPVLFDPGHGLFAWTPLLLLATAGLFALAARRRDLASVLLGLAFLLQVWINGSLESWTQAGAFGSRRFISVTPALAWGLAFLVKGSLAHRLGRKATVVALVLFCWWNVSLMVQFGLKLMDRQRLEWPKVAVNQFTEVPRRLGRTAFLFFSDRERLLKETP